MTIDCVSLWFVATVSLALTQSNHNDRRSLGRVKLLSHLCFIEDRYCGYIEFHAISKWQICSFEWNCSLHGVHFALSHGIHTKS